MVYCGKPSRGCQMCRTRRIKVRALSKQRPGRHAHVYSAMRPSRHATSAPSRVGSARATRTSSTSSSATRRRPRRGEPARRTARPPSSPARSRATAFRPGRPLLRPRPSSRTSPGRPPSPSSRRSTCPSRSRRRATSCPIMSWFPGRATRAATLSFSRRCSRAKLRTPIYASPLMPARWRRSGTGRTATGANWAARL